MCFLEEIHGEVGRGIDRILLVAFAEQLLAMREEVEGTLRNIHLQAGDLLGQFHDQVATALKSLAHVLNALLVTFVSGERRTLRYIVGTAGVLSLQLVHALDNPLRRGDPS